MDSSDASTAQAGRAAAGAPPRASGVTGGDPPEVDVLVVGAGISGIGIAWHLQQRLPGTSFTILEGRDAIGGTWDLFRFPGARSDSDLFTFAYAFKPWRSARALADAGDIQAYLQEAAREFGIERHIRFGHRVVEARWSSAAARWQVLVERTATGERLQMRCRWLFAATGYFRYDQGYTPDFPGIERYRGRVVHPQHWPEGLDYAGQKVLVIGSGATAATLVPAMAKQAGHVTMLQRTPTYVLPMPGVDRVAQLLQRWFGEQRAHAWSRRKNLALQAGIYAFCRKYPNAARRLIRRLNVRFLPAGYPVDVHFRPPYDPWRQRLCVVPDADLFVAIREGRASVVTDHIREFTETGVALASGAHLEADLVVTATGLNLQACGGFPLFLDDRPVALHEGVVYQGMMLSGVPNLAFAFGYTAASWTLRIGPLGEHFCRLLAHMQAHGHDSCVAVPPPGMATCPLLDLESGYVTRSADLLPRQGPAAPWRLAANHAEDLKLMASARVDDPHLHFGRATQPQAAPVAA